METCQSEARMMFLVFFFLNQINPIPISIKDTWRSSEASSTLEHLILLNNRFSTKFLYSVLHHLHRGHHGCFTALARCWNSVRCFCRINTTVLSCGKQITECLWTGTLDSNRRNLYPGLVLLEACDLGKVPWFLLVCEMSPVIIASPRGAIMRGRWANAHISPLDGCSEWY